MQFRLALALFVSILLVGGASWSRFATVEKMPTGIVAVEQIDLSNDNYDEILGDFTGPKTTTATSSENSFSSTDLISHKLIMDYVELATNGGATEANLMALAEQYVESIPTLNKTNNITYADLKTVPNTKANFQKYADELTAIYKIYSESINSNYKNTSSDELNSGLYSFMLVSSNAYATAATKLKNISVPATLTQAHLNLVNSYLSSAGATTAITKAEKDSGTAFAGLITLNENVGKEALLLNEIDRILILNGI